MANQLSQGGAQPQKPPRYAPLFCNRWFTGLWTQRSPLRDAATPFLYEKFYSGTRIESMLDGLNVEVTSNLTVGRRPGLSVYNSQNFSPIDSFYEFKTFSTNSETIKIIADTASTIYDATGPSTKTTIFTKSAGAGQAFFQGVGNTLYFGDGIDQEKYLQINGTFTTQLWGIAIGSVNNATGPTYVGNGADVAVTGGNAWTNPTFITANDNQFAFVTLTPAASGAQGPNPPSTASASGAGQAWSNVNNIFVSDAVYATSTGDTSGNTLFSQELLATGFAFSVPGTATIVGIQVDIQRKRAGSVANTIVDNDITLLKTGNPTGDNKASGTNWPVAEAFASYGNSSDLWGATWTPTDVNASNFGVQISAAMVGLGVSSPVASVDFVRITVTYAATGGLVFSDYLQGTMAGNAFAVSSTNTILGILVEVNGSQTSAAANITVQLIKNGNLVGSTKSAIMTTFTPFGGTGDLWGTTWTANDVDQTNFGVSIQATNTTSGPITFSVDSVRITIYALGGPTVSLVGGGSLTATTGYQYVFAYGNSFSGHVSSPTPLSSLIKPTAQNIQISLTASTDTQVNQIHLYRTKDGGTTLFELPTSPYPNTTQNVVDSNADATLQILNIAPASQFNNPPPAGLINLTYHLQRIFGSVANTVYYSAGPTIVTGNPNEAWPPANFFIFPSQVTRMVPTTLGLLVFTISDIYVIAGQGTSSSPLFSAPYLPQIGLLSYNALDVNGSLIFFFSTQGQQLTLDPQSGISEIGFPIGDLLQKFNPANAYVSWHASGSSDKALYVADGSTGWHRLNPVPAPESGFSWSPKASITHGCKAVQSLEVTPGVHKLLVGPVGTGPILQRDVTTFSDNGLSYSAFFVVGSIVLALPGQLAEVSFLTTESTAIGSPVNVSVLMNEISGPFESLVNPVPDPTQLPSSTSLFSTRGYFSTLQEPAWCRHLQVRFDWPAEASANELLTYTLFGAYHQEA